MGAGFSFRKLSLAQRLVFGAAVWSLVVLVIAAWGLSALYRAQTMRLLEDELNAEITTLTRAVGSQPDGDLGITEQFLPSDPRYTIPYSGTYWTIVPLNPHGSYLEDRRSASFWDGTALWPEEDAARLVESLGEVVFRNAIGPNDERIRVAGKAVTIPSRDEPILLFAAVARQAADNDAQRFLWTLFAAMGVLAAGLLIALFIQVRIGLSPLRQIEEDLADIREGTKTKLSDNYPREVEPLSDELNKLLDHNKDVVERARTHVGNLAHALKTPIAVLQNEATGDDDFSKIVRRQTDAMNRNVQHYLKRAQAAARAQVLGARTEIRPAADDLVRLMTKLFASGGLKISIEADANPVFRGERQDMDDMIGNLLENACKFAKTQVLVGLHQEDGQAVITIDDDGPGLSAEDRRKALERGVRLDETAPGTGLGLSIVSELADLYDGTFELSESPQKGLRAELRLPAA